MTLLMGYFSMIFLRGFLNDLQIRVVIGPWWFSILSGDFKCIDHGLLTSLQSLIVKVYTVRSSAAIVTSLYCCTTPGGASYKMKHDSELPQVLMCRKRSDEVYG